MPHTLSLATRKQKSGFTMIELLAVIVIISSLGTSAFGTFLDFRNEGRRAQVQFVLNTIRKGLTNQKLALKLRCRSFNGYLSGFAVVYNDVNSDYFFPRWECGTVTGAEKKLYDSTIPRNPFKPEYPGYNYVNFSGVSGPSGCGNIYAGDPDSEGNSHAAGWLYNMETGEFWANSNTPGIAECAL